MQLPGLMGSYSHLLDSVGSSVEIDGITPDSDRVLPGYLFVALPGAGEGGHSQPTRQLCRSPSHHQDAGIELSPPHRLHPDCGRVTPANPKGNISISRWDSRYSWNCSTCGSAKPTLCL
jgi:hypothetical protein